MAVYSMTGFGRGEISSKHGCTITVELSSVNRKQLDCSISMPRELASCESKLQTRVASQIKRGYVKGAIVVEKSSAGSGSAEGADLNTLKKQVAALRKAASLLKLEDDLTASSLLRMQDLFKPGQFDIKADRLWPDVDKAVTKALKKLKDMRRIEGEALEKDVRKRFSALRKICLQIEKLAPEVPVLYKKNLEQRISNLLEKSAGVDREILAREVAVFADRCDISEELTRLTSHFDQVDKVFEKGGVCGRTLDFICQEMFREINTTGAKAGYAEISRRVINFKAGLEAVREQVQNIE